MNHNMLIALLLSPWISSSASWFCSQLLHQSLVACCWCALAEEPASAQAGIRYEREA